MSNPDSFPVVELAGRRYVLIRQIGVGQITIVWKAVELPASFDLSAFSWFSFLPTDLGVERLGNEQAFPAAEALENQGKLVAIKIARPGNEEKIKDEGERLKRLAKLARPGAARVIAVHQDLTPDMAILVLEWAPGTSLDNVPAFEEREGLRLSYQLVEFVTDAFDISRIVLTDTLKPGSIFYDETNRSPVLLDLNTVGRPADIPSVTLPILGQTLYRLFTGELITFEELAGFRISGKKIGIDNAAWNELSYGTRSLITDLLLARLRSDEPIQLLRGLVERVDKQLDLTAKDASTLLSIARQAEDPAKRLNAYDLAWQRGASRTGEDERQYREALYSLLGGLPLIENETAWVILNWAHRRFPQDTAVRWAWLARKAAAGDPDLWKNLSPVVGMAQNLTAAQEQIKTLALEMPAGRALALEIEIGRALETCETKPSLDCVASLEQRIENLKDIWQGNHFVEEFGLDWYDPLKRRIDDCRARAGAIQSARERVKNSLDQNKAPASEDIESWSKAEPNNIDLSYLLAAARALENQEHIRCLEQISELTKASPQDELVIRSLEVYRRTGISQVVDQILRDLSEEGEKAEVQDKAQESLRRLLQLVQLENKTYIEAIDELIGRFREVQKFITARQVSEAREACNETRVWLDGKELAHKECQTLNNLAQGVFDRILGRVKRPLPPKKLDQRQGIEKALGDAAAALEEYVRLYPDSAEALLWLDGVRALQKGRFAMLQDPPLWSTAIHNLEQVNAPGWSELQDLARPYLHLARVGARLAHVKSQIEKKGFQLTTAIDELVDLNGELNKLDAKIFEEWKDENISRLVQSTRQACEKAAEEAPKALNNYLTDFLNDLRSPGAALKREMECQRWLEQLPVTLQDPERTMPGKWESLNLAAVTPEARDSFLGEWRARLKALFHYAIARDRLVKAQEQYNDGRYVISNLYLRQAQEAIAQAQAAGYGGPWPDNQPACSVVEEEIRRQRKKAWIEVWHKIKSGKGLEGELIAKDKQAYFDSIDPLLPGETPSPEELFGYVKKLLDPSKNTDAENEWADKIALFPLKAALDGLFSRGMDAIKEQRKKIWLDAWKTMGQLSAGMGYTAQRVQSVLWKAQDDFARNLDKLAEVIEQRTGGAVQQSEQPAEFDALDSLLRSLEAEEAVGEQWAGQMAEFSLQKACCRLCSPESIDRQGTRYAVDVLDCWKKQDNPPSPTYLAVLEDLDGISQRKNTRQQSILGKAMLHALRSRNPGEVGKLFAQTPVDQWQKLVADAMALQHHRIKTRRIVLAVTAIPTLLAALIAVYFFVPPVRETISSTFETIGSMIRSTPFPTPTATPWFVHPQGTLDIGPAQPRAAGTEVHHRVTIRNTGTVSATFRVSPVSNVPTVRWLDTLGAPITQTEVALQPGEHAEFTLVVPRETPFLESEPPFSLNLLGNDILLGSQNVFPWDGSLRIDWNITPTEWVRLRDDEIRGRFTPSIGGDFRIACYDANDALRYSSDVISVGQDEEIPFSCPLAEGTAGRWYIVAIPVPADSPMEPPEQRDHRMPEFEKAITVREPRYSIEWALEEPLLFDPGPNLTVGALYEFLNKGEAPDRYTVEITGTIENVKYVHLAISVVTDITSTAQLTGTVVITHQLTLTPSVAVGPLDLFPPDFMLLPCPAPQSGSCQIVRIAVGIWNERAVGQNRPARLTLRLRSQGGDNLLDIPIEVLSSDLKVVPTWLYFEQP